MEIERREGKTPRTSRPGPNHFVEPIFFEVGRGRKIVQVKIRQRSFPKSLMLISMKNRRRFLRPELADQRAYLVPFTIPSTDWREDLKRVVLKPRVFSFLS